MPQATGGNAPYTYTLSATTADGTLQDGLPTGLGFDPATRTLTGTPTASGAYLMTYSVTDSASTRLSQEFTITVATSAEPLMEVEQTVLQGVALSLTLDASLAISDRFAQFQSIGPGFAVAADGSSFTLPLQSGQSEAPFGDTGGRGGMTLWMTSGSRTLEHDGLNWDGELTETLVGLDGVTSSGLMLGVAWSQSEGDFNYDIPAHIFQGGYSTQTEMLYAYLNWGTKAGRLRVWSMLGAG